MLYCTTWKRIQPSTTATASQRKISSHCTANASTCFVKLGQSCVRPCRLAQYWSVPTGQRKYNCTTHTQRERDLRVSVAGAILVVAAGHRKYSCTHTHTHTMRVSVACVQATALVQLQRQGHTFRFCRMEVLRMHWLNQSGSASTVGRATHKKCIM